MGKAVNINRPPLEAVFRLAKDPKELEKLLVKYGYVREEGLRKADRLVKERLELLKRLK